MTYVVSDIHGEYDLFTELLEKIGLKDEDTLYILGDILDRGAHPIKTFLKLMEMSNAICLAGSHELMALACLGFYIYEEVAVNEKDYLLVHAGISTMMIHT